MGLLDEEDDGVMDIDMANGECLIDEEDKVEKEEEEKKINEEVRLERKEEKDKGKNNLNLAMESLDLKTEGREGEKGEDGEIE